MRARLDRVLRKLGAAHAPHLLNHYEQMEGDQIARIQWLARQLAGYNQVVLVGKLHEMDNVDLYFQDWLRGFGQFYALLTGILYPSFNQISASDGDDVQNPYIVVLDIDLAPICNALAGYVVPYLAWRQHQRPYSEPELRGMMDIVLNEGLRVNNLSSSDYNQLKTQGVTVLKQMLSAQMNYISVTTFDQPILNLLPPQSPAPPIMLPEEQRRQERRFTAELEQVERQEVDTTPSEEMFSPIPNERRVNGIATRANRSRAIPLPNLPKRNGS